MFLLLLMIVQAPASLSLPDTPPVIRTTGTATKPVAPDRVTVSIGVSTRGRTPSQAGGANAGVANAVRQALTALGVPSDSITTQGYSVQLDAGPYGRDTTFISTNTVLVRLRRLSLIGRVIDTALTAGATNLQGVAYSADDLVGPSREALDAAVVDARTKATRIAKAAGGHLGRLILLTTEPPATASRWDISDMAVMSPGVVLRGGEGTTITAHTLNVTSWVLGQWEFIPDPR